MPKTEASAPPAGDVGGAAAGAAGVEDGVDEGAGVAGAGATPAPGWAEGTAGADGGAATPGDEGVAAGPEAAPGAVDDGVPVGVGVVLMVFSFSPVPQLSQRHAGHGLLVPRGPPSNTRVLDPCGAVARSPDSPHGIDNPQCSTLNVKPDTGIKAGATPLYKDTEA